MKWQACLTLCILAVGQLDSSLTAQVVTIDFEGLPGADFTTGTHIPSASALSNQLAQTCGAIFSTVGGSPYVAVLNLGQGHAASGTNGIGGVDANGDLSYTLPIRISFVLTNDGSTPAIVDFVSLRNDLLANSGRPVTLSAYTATGAYIATATAIDDHPFTLSVTNIGIHSVITTVPVEYEAAALDDFTFTVPTASPTNALPINLQAQRAIAVSWASESNRVYQVQWTPSLNTNLWGPLVSSVVGSGSTNTIFDIAEPGSRFYRVIVLR